MCHSRLLCSCKNRERVGIPCRYISHVLVSAGAFYPGVSHHALIAATVLELRRFFRLWATNSRVTGLLSRNSLPSTRATPPNQRSMSAKHSLPIKWKSARHSWKARSYQRKPSSWSRMREDRRENVCRHLYRPTTSSVPSNKKQKTHGTAHMRSWYGN
jgi:hypothetical protein